MAIKRLLTVTGSLVAAWLLSGCPSTCVEDLYAFRVGFRAVPEQGVLEVGDTLWLVAETPVTFEDIGTGETIPYDGVDLGATVRIARLTPDSAILSDAAHHFDIEVLQGELRRRDDWAEERQPNRGRAFAFEETDGYYRFRGALVARHTGSYVLAFARASGVYRESDGDCQRASFTYYFENADKHLEALAHHYYQDYPIPPSDTIGVYGFEVVE